MNYDDFLKTKDVSIIDSGFDVEVDKLNKYAFDWQRDIVRWAIKKGKAALFEDCGLGKTLQELMIADEIRKKTSKPVLIFTPLAVASQTVAEGLKNLFRPSAKSQSHARKPWKAE